MTIEPKEHGRSSVPGARYTIRRLEPDDAEACFRIRTDAFVQRFYAEMGPEGVAAGINAYLPSDYARLAETSPAFVAVEEGVVVGFAALRVVDEATAGIHFLYVRLDRTGRGIGRVLVERLESCVRGDYPQIARIVLNTAVPRYNQGFYERMGYVHGGEGVCHYPGRSVRAVQMVKELK
jgi:GNAT superfamily N-acetyltransferase